MDEIRLKNIVQNEIDNAIGYIETETTEARRRAIQFYNREPYGNEVDGRSKIVTGEVAEAIDGALPSIMRVFTSSDEVVRFEPNGPGDEQKAKQATEYCNYVFMRDNPGIKVMHTWFKDALLSKVGTVKVYWKDETEVNTESYENLLEDELAMMMADETMEIVSQEQNVIAEPINPMTQEVEPIYSYNVKVKKTNKKGRVVIENVPPEEFIVSKKVIELPDAPFVAHRRLITRSELVAMGYDRDTVDSLPTYDDLTYTPERVARYTQGEQPDDVSLDTSMQEVECFECFIRVDFDGDGIAELRKVFYAANEILENEEIDYVPFCSLCPFPLPHKFFGQSLADRTMDIQLIKSTLVRQQLDNLYLVNNARVVAVDGQVNLDDLLTVTPGGIVRVKNPSAVTPLQVQSVVGQSFPMLEYMDNVQAKRTGVNDASQGLDPNILQNTTAAAISAMQNAAGAKMELIARLFAEDGVKNLFKNILHLLCKYQDKARVIRLRGQYVAMDPREWTTQYDVVINVGLGTGTKEQHMTMLSMVLQKQEQILQQYGPGNPLVSVGQYRNTLGRFIEAAGFKDSAEFFRDIPPEVDQALSQPQPQGQQQDPAVMAYMQQMQAQIEATMAKAQADIEARQMKAMADIEIAKQKAAADIQIKQQEFETEARLKATERGLSIAQSL